MQNTMRGTEHTMRGTEQQGPPCPQGQRPPQGRPGPDAALKLAPSRSSPLPPPPPPPLSTQTVLTWMMSSRSWKLSRTRPAVLPQPGRKPSSSMPDTSAMGICTAPAR
jgi:hypothetical protein